MNLPDRSFRVKTAHSQRVIAASARIPAADWPLVLGSLLEQVWKFLNSLESVTVGPAMARLPASESAEALLAGFPVAESVEIAADLTLLELPTCEIASAIVEGPYERLDAAIEELAERIARRGLTADGGPWLIFWVDPDQATTPAELRTEIAWPLRMTNDYVS
jgi:effector-binding domain-containing protein